MTRRMSSMSIRRCSSGSTGCPLWFGLSKVSGGSDGRGRNAILDRERVRAFGVDAGVSEWHRQLLVAHGAARCGLARVFGELHVTDADFFTDRSAQNSRPGVP